MECRISGASGLRVSAAASDTGAAWQRLAAEAMLSALVVGAHCAAAARRWTGAAPLLHAAAYIAATLVALPYLNPARALGVAFVLGHWERHWVHWLGPLAGVVPVALLLEWTTRRPRHTPPADDENYDDLDKGGYPPTGGVLRHAPSYCAAPAPTPNGSEPLYGGTKSLYCRSPQPARHALHRSQSVYSKSSCPGGPLVPAQSLVVRAGHALAHSQNAHNAHREPAYGPAANRPGPTGAAGPVPTPAGDRRDSLYGSEGGRRTAHALPDDSAYGTYSRAAPYRPHHHTLVDPY
ncbi:Neurogenic protein big brain [Eumeta japonica]|uniref:Neurogenic protein big brain n=1 Tax=Eumeta variegata TaxID=151549 RepID=A0A4C1WG43_EUMVA|nr:Neurogenic protein big brain [Eumeta japonica]